MSKKEPLVSVIVPIYNVEKYVRECLESIRSQSYKNIEVLMVNDGSTDKSPEICKEYEEKDKRFRLYNKKNGGLSDARNYGLDRMKGEYVCFVDGDDMIDHEYMAIMLYALVDNPSCLISCCRYRRFGVNQSVDLNQSLRQGIFKIKTDDYLCNTLYQYDQTLYSVSSCTKLYAKRIFQSCRFPSNILYEDFSIFDETISNCKYIIATNDNLYYYRISHGSITNSAFDERKLVLLDHCDKIKKNHMGEKRVLDAVNVMEFTRCCELLSLISSSSLKKEKSIIVAIWSRIKKTRGAVLLAGKSRFRVRVAAIISFFGMHFFLTILALFEERTQ